MPKKRHSPEQIAAALRQAEAGTPIVEITRKLGVHENTFYLLTCSPVRAPEIGVESRGLDLARRPPVKEKPIQRTADRRDPQAARSRQGDQRSLS